MSKADLHQRLNSASEITLSVKCRKSTRDIPRPVWFVHEDNTLYLLPVQGSDTNWYENLQANPTLNISVNGADFAKIVDLRNDVMHYTPEFRPPIDNLTSLYDSYRYEHAELAVKTMDSMIERLCVDSNIPIPKWLVRFRGSFGYWDDAFS